MNAEAKRVNIHWRRSLFGAHLLIWLLVRLAIGSIDEMPPEVIYHWLTLWAFGVYGHGILLAIFDGRDRADLPDWLQRLIEPRERRWSLLALNAMLWIIATMAIASRVIPYETISRYAAPLSLVWLALTAAGLFQTLLVLYAEVRDRTALRKRKNGARQLGEAPALRVERLELSDDGELVELDDYRPDDEAHQDSL